MSTVARLPRRLPQYVTEWKDRHGRVRLRFQRGSGDRRVVYLKSRRPFSAEFNAEYAALLAGEHAGQQPKGPPAGTVADLILRFYATPSWQGASDSYKRPVRALLERVRENLGDIPARSFRVRDAEELLSQYEGRPHVGNRLRKVLSQVWKVGERHELVERNVWKLTDPFPTEGTGFHSWTEAEIAQFRRTWNLGTRERLAMELLLGTAQRPGDVRLLGPLHLRDGRLELRQSKTGTVVDLPVVPELAAALEQTPLGKETFLATIMGDAFTSAGFGNWFGDACAAAGVPGRAHGLRKAALRRLAEAGATHEQLKAVSGHKTDSELAVYTAAASKRRLADAAMALVRDNPAAGYRADAA